jgi:hypothetical protein
MFHEAPELMRLPPNASDGNPEADIYSFAMIAYQVCLQQELFVDTNMPADGKLSAPADDETDSR